MMGLYVWWFYPAPWGNLFTEDGNRGAEAGEQRQCEGCSDWPRPSMKLCTASLTVIIHATVFILDIPLPFSQRQVNNTAMHSAANLQKTDIVNRSDLPIS